VNFPTATPSIPQNLPESLREKARLILDGVSPEKIQKASLSSLALATDRLLNRAEAIENRGTNLAPFLEMWDKYGLTTSHSASRVTLRARYKSRRSIGAVLNQQNSL
jgi:hypothetical protein